MRRRRSTRRGPLWQFHLVDNYAGGSALIARIHHCYADGIALVRVLLSMTDAGPDGPPAMPSRRPRKPASARTAIDPLAQLAAARFPASMKMALNSARR